VTILHYTTLFLYFVVHPVVVDVHVLAGIVHVVHTIHIPVGVVVTIKSLKAVHIPFLIKVTAHPVHPGVTEHTTPKTVVFTTTKLTHPIPHLLSISILPLTKEELHNKSMRWFVFEGVCVTV
jgi:hypothetical protein